MFDMDDARRRAWWLRRGAWYVRHGEDARRIIRAAIIPRFDSLGKIARWSYPRAMCRIRNHRLMGDGRRDVNSRPTFYILYIVIIAALWCLYRISAMFVSRAAVSLNRWALSKVRFVSGATNKKTHEGTRTGIGAAGCQMACQVEYAFASRRDYIMLMCISLSHETNLEQL